MPDRNSETGVLGVLGLILASLVVVFGSLIVGNMMRSEPVDSGALTVTNYTLTGVVVETGKDMTLVDGLQLVAFHPDDGRNLASNDFWVGVTAAGAIKPGDKVTCARMQVITLFRRGRAADIGSSIYFCSKRK